MPARGPDHPLLGARYSLPIKNPKYPYPIVTDRQARRSIEEHRAVWEYFNGPIPAGHEIHHINEDKSDNRIENLECLTDVDHMRIHKGWCRVGDSWEKACTICGRWLPLTAFHPRPSKSPVSVRPECKPCSTDVHRRYIAGRNAQ